MLFFHPKDRTIKGISPKEISSFRCLGNFSVVYCKWNSLLSINHIKGKGLGDILSLHVLAWVKEKPSPGKTRCLREMISTVSVVVKCWGRSSFLLWDQEITTRSENVVLWWTLKSPAALSTCNFPEGYALRPPLFSKSAAYFKLEQCRWVKLIPGLYNLLSTPPYSTIVAIVFCSPQSLLLHKKKQWWKESLVSDLHSDFCTVILCNF